MHFQIRDQIALPRPGSRLSEPRDARLARALGAVVEESVAQRVVRTCGQNGLEQFTVAELVSSCGVTKTQARRIAAARDLAVAFSEGRETARHAGDVLDHLPPGLATLETEVLLGFALSGTLAIQSLVLLAKGGAASAAITPRDVFVPLVRLGAASVIVVHNHPSGDPSPSEADVAFTNALARAGSVLGIELVDHIVIARGGSVSFADMGLLPTRKELGHE